MFGRGELSREELHAHMAEHARRLIEDMEDARRHPLALYLDEMVNRRAAARLAKRHGEATVRAVFSTLAEIPGFPPAVFLWNANHWDVPLHCFLRMRRAPVFRVLRMEGKKTALRVLVEYGDPEAPDSRETFREEFKLVRFWHGDWVVDGRFGGGVPSGDN